MNKSLLKPWLVTGGRVTSPVGPIGPVAPVCLVCPIAGEGGGSIFQVVDQLKGPLCPSCQLKRVAQLAQSRGFSNKYTNMGVVRVKHGVSCSTRCVKGFGCTGIGPIGPIGPSL